MKQYLIIGGTSKEVELNRKAQLLAFKLGFKWYGGGKVYKDYTVDYGRIYYYCDSDGILTYGEEEYVDSDFEPDVIIDLYNYNGKISSTMETE